MNHLKTRAVICKVLRKYDPIGKADEDDSYEVESTILARRFTSSTSVEDWRRALHENLEFWSDEETAGSEDGYQTMAEELWRRFHMN